MFRNSTVHRCHRTERKIICRKSFMILLQQEKGRITALDYFLLQSYDMSDRPNIEYCKQDLIGPDLQKQGTLCMCCLLTVDYGSIGTQLYWYIEEATARKILMMNL
jgi:hypothetical protein